jgi:hypothetical protein
MLKEITTQLKALYENYILSHWTIYGQSFFGDHEFFKNSYEMIQGEVDSLAEKSIALGEGLPYDPKIIPMLLEGMMSEPDLFKRALSIEIHILNILEELMSKQGRLPQGVFNLLGEIADRHENQVYKIRQRLKSNPLTRTAKDCFKIRYTNAPIKYEPPRSSQYRAFVNFQGFPLDLEYLPGDVRHGKPLLYAYGEIQGAKGADGENLDIFVGPNMASPLVVVIHQAIADTGEYDEDKLMLGFDSRKDAIEAYIKMYSPDFVYGTDSFALGSLWLWLDDLKNHGKMIYIPSVESFVSQLNTLDDLVI